MSDITTKGWWDREANAGIIGLSPPPWDFSNTYMDFCWPTHGYDGALRTYPDDYDQLPSIEATGRTREEWLALADAMIVRWTTWRTAVGALP